jgi:glycosyltransferase involved in cell wall biosynthesis
MIEAMACGTPVIAFRCGSVPEVVDVGVTGFIVDDEADAVEAIGRLGSLDRSCLFRAAVHGQADGRGIPLLLRDAERDQRARWGAILPAAKIGLKIRTTKEPTQDWGDSTVQRGGGLRGRCRAFRLK